MSWLRIFESYRNIEAEKIAAGARAEFLQDQVTQLQDRVEVLDARAQSAQDRLLADREKVADMFAVRVMEEGVYDPNRLHPAQKRMGTQAGPGPVPGPQRVPAHIVARAMTRQAFADDAQRMKAEAEELQRVAETQLGIKLSGEKDETANAQAPTG